MAELYDWEKDPECSRLRHPAGRHVVQVGVEFAPAWWWWAALVAAVVVSAAAAVDFFLLN